MLQTSSLTKGKESSLSDYLSIGRGKKDRSMCLARSKRKNPRQKIELVSPISFSTTISVCNCLLWIIMSSSLRGARGVMVIIVANGHGDTNSNPGRY